jgi:hypothetical protein
MFQSVCILFNQNVETNIWEGVRGTKQLRKTVLDERIVSVQSNANDDDDDDDNIIQFFILTC